VVIPRFRCQLLAETGRTAQEIFESEGDEALRTLESHVLAEAIAQPLPVVIAVAGGVVLSEANRSLLERSGVVVWLRATIATLSERVEHGGVRPRLGADPRSHCAISIYPSSPLRLGRRIVIDVDDLPPKKWSRASSTTPVWVTSSSRA